MTRPKTWHFWHRVEVTSSYFARFQSAGLRRKPPDCLYLIVNAHDWKPLWSVWLLVALIWPQSHIDTRAELLRHELGSSLQKVEFWWWWSVMELNVDVKEPCDFQIINIRDWRSLQNCLTVWLWYSPFDGMNSLWEKTLPERSWDDPDCKSTCLGQKGLFYPTGPENYQQSECIGNWGQNRTSCRQPRRHNQRCRVSKKIHELGEKLDPRVWNIGP